MLRLRSERLDATRRTVASSELLAFLVITLVALSLTLRRVGARVESIEREVRAIVPGLAVPAARSGDGLARMAATVTAVARMARSERERLDCTLDSAHVVLWTVDPAGPTLELEGRGEGVASGFEEDLPGDFETWHERIHPDDEARVMAALRGVRGPGDPIEVEYRLVQPDGRLVWLLMRGSLLQRQLPGSPEPVMMARGVAIDVTRQKTAEERARQATELHQRALHDLQEIVYQTDLDGAWTLLNPAWTAITGFGVHDALGRPSTDYLHPVDRQVVSKLLLEIVSGQRERIHCELRLLTADGDWRWIEASSRLLRDAAGAPVGTAGILHDATEKRAAEAALQAANATLERRVDERTEQLRRLNEQLVHDAFHDNLTGLPNRALFVDRLSQAIERARRAPRRSYAVLLLDFDRFKIVNDCFGHAHGDALLREMARRLVATVRPADTLARLGGDEFTVLLEDLEDAGEAARVAARLERGLLEPFTVAGRPLHVTASIGLAAGSAAYDAPGDVLRDAEIAMYQSKTAGRARLTVFERAMRERALQAVTLEADLRAALARGALSVQYQPIVSTEDGSVVGLEALARWPHPTFGLVPPGQFIAVAEETGLIVDLDRFVMRTALRDLARWRADAPGRELTLGFNLSGQQFQRDDLVAEVTRALAANRLPACAVNVEITESLMLATSPRVSNNLDGLRRLGVKLHIDDFGTGYSSLGYLQRFSADAIKIDRVFVSNMLSHPESAELVRTIVQMASHLGMSVIAEGVERHEQLERLRASGCRYAQGFLFARPMDATAVGGFLAASAVVPGGFARHALPAVESPS